MKAQAQKIGVVGAGWLGLPLGAALSRSGHTVYGSTTRKERFPLLRQEGLVPFLLELAEQPAGDVETLAGLDVLIVNVPPSTARRYDGLNHLQQLDRLTRAITKAGIKKVLYISTTSVYPDESREMREQDAAYVVSRHSGQVPLQFEDCFREASDFESTIIRFGGLFGPERHPGYFFKRRREVSHGGAPVNMIAQQDCIGIIQKVIETQTWGETFNACAPEHPSKRTFYTTASQQVGTELPIFLDEATSGKWINSDKLRDLLKYEFRYPNPLAAL